MEGKKVDKKDHKSLHVFKFYLENSDTGKKKEYKSEIQSVQGKRVKMITCSETGTPQQLKPWRHVRLQKCEGGYGAGQKAEGE